MGRGDDDLDEIDRDREGEVVRLDGPNIVRSHDEDLLSSIPSISANRKLLT